MAASKMLNLHSCIIKPGLKSHISLRHRLLWKQIQWWAPLVFLLKAPAFNELHIKEGISMHVAEFSLPHFQTGTRRTENLTSRKYKGKGRTNRSRPCQSNSELRSLLSGSVLICIGSCPVDAEAETGTCQIGMITFFLFPAPNYCRY